MRSKLKLLSTYFLVSHGSRDPRSLLELHILAGLLSRQINLTGNLTSNDLLKCPLIGTGVLELGLKSLHEQIEDFREKRRSLYINQVKIIPLFLLPGVHVTEDIPAEVEVFRHKVKAKEKSKQKSEFNSETYSQSKITLCPYIGSHPEMARLLAAKVTSVTADAWVVISHGSRRPGGNEPVEKIAESLASSCQVLVCTAYWSVCPDLKSRVEILIRQGYQRIGILPYFLFNGGITDAIADTVNQFTQIYPAIKFCLSEPLGATDELAKLVLDLISETE
ncbi:MAG: sirohydrochlorin chelatase [Okeania sp. SIO1H6]|nr:sirohydrochlorin chelatase [Okeania sp. SIO1H4]NET12111.1 sirohydrochlorin chelatase [Okeania sp. SIO1H6]NET22675.1 sirohydrochlorin chelatase [Okeania sp. SIO1H5]NET95327.1 sirohydrochlorin chelatase [Okeania sp. SIO1H2]RQH25090.1 sirohydrochlorin chelatase [Okeania hirsuta]